MQPADRGNTIKMKISKRQLRRIIREAIDYPTPSATGDDFRDEVKDSITHQLWTDSPRSGMDLVAAVQNEYMWSKPPTQEDVFKALDELLEEDEVIFNVEEDEWSLNERGNYYDYMAGFKS